MGFDRGVVWGVGNEVIVVVSPVIRKCKWGWGVLSQKIKIKPPGLDFRCAIENGNGEQWGEVVEWRL
jgi:hypothetical protein